jgi:FSR family fosmidomycin resistance protein-like MFS transporter
MSAGVTIGLSIGLGGLGAPLLGLIGDAHGLRAVFETIAVLPLAALLLTPLLPSGVREESHGTTQPEEHWRAA